MTGQSRLNRWKGGNPGHHSRECRSIAGLLASSGWERWGSIRRRRTVAVHTRYREQHCENECVDVRCGFGSVIDSDRTRHCQGPPMSKRRLQYFSAQESSRRDLRQDDGGTCAAQSLVSCVSGHWACKRNLSYEWHPVTGNRQTRRREVMPSTATWTLESGSTTRAFGAARKEELGSAASVDAWEPPPRAKS